MKKKFGLSTAVSLSVAAAITLLSELPAQAASFTNGSFEMGPDPVLGFISLYGGSVDITGWTVTGHSIDHIGSYWQPSDGSKSLDLSGSGMGGIEQTFDTIVGQWYELLFDLAGNPGGPPTKQINVYVAGISQIFSFQNTGLTTSSNMGWETQRLLFQALGSSTTLGFTSLIDDFSGPALDNVRINAMPVPVPTPALLPGLIGLGVGVLRKRKGEAVEAEA